MTSKEALKKIYNTGANMVIGTPLDNFFKEELQAIAKDLEVLELIKALFKENVELGSKLCIGKNYYDIAFILFNSKDAYNKIKEWLKEDTEWGQYE